MFLCICFYSLLVFGENKEVDEELIGRRNDQRRDGFLWKPHLLYCEGRAMIRINHH